MSFWIIKLTIIPQICEDWIWIWSIDFCFGKYFEISVEILLDEFLNLSFASTFLVEELIAWKCQNLEATATQLIMQFDHFLVVRRSQSSLACHIYNHNNFLVFKLFEVNDIPIDIFSLQVKEVFRNFMWDHVWPTLENCFTHQFPHSQYIYIYDIIEYYDANIMKRNLIIFVRKLGFKLKLLFILCSGFSIFIYVCNRFALQLKFTIDLNISNFCFSRRLIVN